MYVLNHALIWLMQQDPTDKFVKTVSDWVLGKMPAFLGLAFLAVMGMIVWSLANPYAAAKHGGKVITIFIVALGTPIGLGMIAWFWKLGGGA